MQSEIMFNWSITAAGVTSCYQSTIFSLENVMVIIIYLT
jgi:hypothetical protein